MNKKTLVQSQSTECSAVVNLVRFHERYRPETVHTNLKICRMHAMILKNEKKASIAFQHAKFTFIQLFE